MGHLLQSCGKVLMQNSLYYESHITIEPVFEARLELFKSIAKKHNFRVAELLMVKQNKPSGPSQTDSFCTSRSKDYSKIVNDTYAMVQDLQLSGFDVWRYKIEDTLLDSKIEDKWKLLPTSMCTLAS
jgi:hypothetical protein